MHLTLLDHTRPFGVQRRESPYQVASRGRNPLLFSFSQAQPPSQTSPAMLVNLAFIHSSRFCPSEYLTALGHPCCSVRVTRGQWVLSFHTDWKPRLLLHFQLPRASSRGLKNTEHSTKAGWHFHFISLCFPQSSQAEPLISFTVTVFSLLTPELRFFPLGPCSIPFWNPFPGAHSKPQSYVISFRHWL